VVGDKGTAYELESHERGRDGGLMGSKGGSCYF
jgi:hypothetical protein